MSFAPTNDTRMGNYYFVKKGQIQKAEMRFLEVANMPTLSFTSSVTRLVLGVSVLRLEALNYRYLLLDFTGS